MSRISSGHSYSRLGSGENTRIGGITSRWQVNNTQGKTQAREKALTNTPDNSQDTPRSIMSQSYNLCNLYLGRQQRLLRTGHRKTDRSERTQRRCLVEVEPSALCRCMLSLGSSCPEQKACKRTWWRKMLYPDIPSSGCSVGSRASRIQASST